MESIKYSVDLAKMRHDGIYGQELFEFLDDTQSDDWNKPHDQYFVLPTYEGVWMFFWNKAMAIAFKLRYENYIKDTIH